MDEAKPGAPSARAMTPVMVRLDTLTGAITELTRAVKADHDVLVAFKSFVEGQNLAGQVQGLRSEISALEGRLSALEGQSAVDKGRLDTGERLIARVATWILALCALAGAVFTWFGPHKGAG